MLGAEAPREPVNRCQVAQVQVDEHTLAAGACARIEASAHSALPALRQGQDDLGTGHGQ